MPPSSSLPLFSTSSDNRAAALQTLLIAVIVIGALYFGREILLPLALAVLLSFVLTPPLLLLRRIKVPRVAAVGVVVILAFAVIFALGWLLSREVGQLAADLPSYRHALAQKIKSFRESTPKSPTLERAGEVLSELEKELSSPKLEAPPAPKVGSEADRPEDRPIVVELTERDPTVWQMYQNSRRHASAAPRHCRHRAAVCRVHSASTRRPTRQNAETPRRLGPAPRHDDNE